MKPTEIRERLQQTGRSQIALGRAIGKSKDSVSRLLKGERGIDVEEAAQIRAFFDGSAALEPAFQQIPVFGFAAAGGEDRISLASDHILDRIEVPVGLVRGDVMAVRVAGDSMEPRLFSGETVIVGRGVKPSRFGDCIVEMKDGSALVKQYRGQRDGYHFLFQYNPEQELRLPSTQVRAVHAVLYRR